MKKPAPSTIRYIALWMIGIFICIVQNIPESFALYAKPGINVIIPLVVAVAMFENEYAGALFGLTCGLFLDTFGNPKIAFCAIVLMITGCVCGLLAKHLINAFFFSGLLMSLGGCFIFYTLHWFLFYVLEGLENSLYYFTNYSVVSILISFLFIIPFYFLVKLIHNKTLKGR